MDTSEGSVAHRNFTSLADAIHLDRGVVAALTTRVDRLEHIVAQQEIALNELRGMMYAMRGTGPTT